MRVLFLLLLIISCNSQTPELSAINNSVNNSYPYIVFPNPDIYSLNDTINFTVHYERPTVATLSRVSFMMDSSGTLKYADLSNGNGTEVHKYSYTVASGDGDIDGIFFQSLDHAAGSIIDEIGNVEVSFSSKSLPDVKVDSNAPTVSSINVTGKAGFFLIGEYVEIIMNLSEAVTVTGNPRFSMELDFGGTRYADYYAGSGTSQLKFRYRIVNGDQDLDGISYNYLIDRSGGNIKDLAGNQLEPYVDSSIPLPNVKIDAKAPQIISVTTNARAYKPGQSVTLTVTFDEPVIRSVGTSLDFQIKANSAAPSVSRSALSYSAGTSSSISYSYTIAAGDIDFDGFQYDTGSLSSNGTELKDSVGHDADLTLPASDTFSRAYAVPTSMTYWYDVSDPSTISYPIVGSVPTSFFSKSGGLSGNLNYVTYQSGFNGTSFPYLRFSPGASITFTQTVNYRYAVIVHRTPVAIGPDKTLFKDIDGIGDFQLTFRSDGSVYGGLDCSLFCRYFNGGWSSTTAGIFPFPNPDNTPLITVLEYTGSGGLGVNSVRLQIGGGDYNGDIAEIIFFNDDPTTLMNGQIHEHLKAKYNVDFAP